MINKAILMGRLTRDPELRHTNSGTAVCSFSIAIDGGYGENRRTDFINCVAWSKTAEFVTNYFSKGKMIIVEGRIQSRSWDDPNGGKRYATEVVAENVSFGETKKSSESNGYGGANGGNSGGYGNYGADDSFMPPVPKAPPLSSMPDSMESDGFTEQLETDDDLPF